MTSKGDRSRYALALGALAASLGLASFGGCAKSTTITCQFNSDCDVGFYCGGDGKCVRDCVDASRDCAKGYICNHDGQCEAGTGGAGSTGTGGGAGTTSNGTASNGTGVTSGPGSTSTGSPTSTAASSSSTGGGTKGQLDVCFSDGECGPNLFCRAMTVGSAMRCTPACSTDASCPSGFRCVDPGNGKVCLMSDIGRTCTAANQCNYACLVAQQYCTSQCTSGADCPNGYGCQMVQGLNICVKAEAYCGQGSPASVCIAPAACDTSTTQLLVSSCTLACNSAADCPQRAAGLAPWTCNGICQRPGDVYGPLEGGAPAEYYCNASNQVINLCNDAQHIDFTQFTIPNPPQVNCGSGTSQQGVAGDACVDSCRFQGGCPYAFGCTAVGGVNGGRIGLCLRAGLGEVGTACTTDAQCVFGYCSMNKCSRDCTKDGICPTGSSCVAAGGPAVEGLAFRRCQ